MNETGRRVREQYADTGGFTDHVFAACSILGYAFVPRIRDLPSKRLYVFERAGVPKHLRSLVGHRRSECTATVARSLPCRQPRAALHSGLTGLLSSRGVNADAGLLCFGISPVPEPLRMRPPLLSPKTNGPG